MSLPGTRIGPYEVLVQIGAGGMGEVYRARDTKLGRDVALKMLPSDVVHDAGRLARFRREAQVLASLNHPGIAHLYGLDDSTPQPVLVMELVEGQTLADRIASGPISLADALPIAMQIAEAVEAAHESGIVHRDLKPANIKVRPDGAVKILDFGLARASDTSYSADTPTLTLATSPGTVLGTAAYMAPEQAKGLKAGPQADIWAFGCVLFEMLSGRPAFARGTFVETIANVIGGAPDLDSLPSGTPPLVRRVVRRCLEKDLRQRFHHMADARIDLADALSPADTTAPQPASRRPAAWILPVVAASAIATVAATVGWWAAQRGAREPATPVRLALPFVDAPLRRPFGARHVAISSDGQRVAYAAGQLWIRRLQERDARSLGISGIHPFFSPDGQWVGIFAHSGLQKVPVDGGSPTMVAENTERPGGGAWLDDGTIVFATNAGIYRVAADGGRPELIAAPNREKGERLFTSPTALPGGRAILFTVSSGEPKLRLTTAALDLATKAITAVLDDASSAIYYGTGHLVYTSGSSLRAIAFDLAALKPTGRPFDLPDADVAVASDNGFADYALSRSGTLVFLPTFLQQEPRSLIWIDRNGVQQPLPVEARPYQYPRVSPDGRRVALDVRGNNRDIWILDLERLTQVQLTDGPTEDMLPEWSQDGSRIFFASDRQGNFDVYSQPADGAAPPIIEYSAPGFQAPQSLTPDRTGVVIVENFRALSLVHRSIPPRLEPLLHLDTEAVLGEVSPDGKWMAYESKESGGNWEVYVRPFPNVNQGREKISTAGGRFPRWNRNGSELYFVEPDGDMMAASVMTAPTLRVLRLTTLFHWHPPGTAVSGRLYDVSPIDGRFLAFTPLQKRGQTLLSVVLNWTTELLRRERAAGLE